ncbi:MAG: transcriptional repressor [Alphaproteobacteria bacterium GM7ARS4]|nr:transcriptional repressor [Alphaproteobacteria bacterium GM7ARS4]
MSIVEKIEALCHRRGLRMTEQRRLIAHVLEQADDHPDVEELYRRAQARDSSISIGTVYRTVRMLEDAGILARHGFGGSRSRYEPATEEHHDHLVDVRSGKVIEFSNDDIERLQHKIAQELGYRLIGHRLELYAVPLEGRDKEKS